jgi:hypothetical protein
MPLPYKIVLDRVLLNASPNNLSSNRGYRYQFLSAVNNVSQNYLQTPKLGNNIKVSALPGLVNWRMSTPMCYPRIEDNNTIRNVARLTEYQYRS